MKAMVFFVCETCNETMKKNQVEKHVYKCRQCKAVTCVDCSQTFYGDDYIEHITCVSEAEKYEKTLYKPKANTKLNPQDAWVELINNATSSIQITKAPNNIRQYLNRIGELTNVPRNKKKFMNFAKNSLKLYNDNLLELIWNYLDSFRIDQIQKQQSSSTLINSDDTNDVTVTNQTTNEIENNSIPDVMNDEESIIKAKKEKKKLKKEMKRKLELITSSSSSIENNDEKNIENNNIDDIDNNGANDNVLEKKKSKKKKHKVMESN